MINIFFICQELELDWSALLGQQSKVKLIYYISLIIFGFIAFHSPYYGDRIEIDQASCTVRSVFAPHENDQGKVESGHDLYRPYFLQLKSKSCFSRHICLFCGLTSQSTNFSHIQMEIHQENMSVKCIPPHTPHLYSKTGVRRGIPIFLNFAPKHRLWVLVRTASPRRF